MKRYIFIIIPVILISIYYSSKDRPKSIQPQVEVDHKFSEEIVVVAPTKAAKASESPVPPKPLKAINPVSIARSIPPGMVEFQLMADDWAVAFGDILLGKLQSKMDGSKGQFKPKKSVLWDSNVIPYGYSSSLPKDQISEIEFVIQNIFNITAVELTQIDPQYPPDDYIIFTASEDICASYLGKIGGAQPIFLKKTCRVKEIVHEIMHALGFVHEQSRADRDQYVKINWDNIQEGFENQFDIAPDVYLESYRGFVFNFDYQSVMLYGPKHFAKTKSLKTIESKTNKDIDPAQSGLSPGDLQRINYLYRH